MARKSLLHRAAQKMKDCQENHTYCHPGGSFFPTRVIDVWADPTRESRVRLHEDKNTIAPYAALSYCWGGPQPLATTSRTYLSHIEHGFEISDTPPTIQDAIATTRTLGLRYLWIDAICIIQDSEADKQHEISHMRSIYKNSYITIVATTTRSVSRSFLDHVAPLRTELRIPTHDHSDAQKRGVLHFRQRLDPTSTLAEDKHRRAWTLQERLLSPRDLIFRDNSLVWQCRENDEMIFGEVHGSQTSGSNQLPLSMLSYNQDSDMPPGIQIRDVERVWGELLSDYGDRDLTNAEDKLIALAGITEEFHRVFEGRYLAGLWERNLPQELVWAIANPQPPMREYTAPSWSWASVKGKVMTFPWMTARDFEVLECQVDLATEQLPFGAVTGGYLKVKGVLKEAKFDIIDQFLLPLLLPKKDQDECVEIGTVLLDALPDEILDGSITAQSRIRKRIWCLQVTWAVGPGSVGMALVPAHDHTFRRIGKFSAPGKKDWFSGSEKQIVIIE
ncbi:hypothetical protein MPDQ_006079 [Monascus purpureus]|uniref:Heterokaryon incompatibility domain-containing protein n=1 Tax=Monascus purpureus TaxID=5098 RepID=A0A507QYP5_MONPU|nr:hypothetical protein MPDQ_006079 [Monascus purpureus]